LTVGLGKIVALIPARGGSKSIPDKNIVDLGGRPLIDYCIMAALESSVEEVWVSTDSEDIEAVALDSGASVLIRPEELSGDSSNSEDALLHFAKCVPDFQTLVFLQCTSPLTLSSDIDGALDVLRYNPYDSVLSVCSDSGGWLCGGWNWTYDNETGGAERTNEYFHQRQNAPECYRENGAIYVTYKDKLLEYKSRVGGKTGMYVMPRQRSFEIDDPEDLKEIRFFLKNKFAYALDM